MATPSGEALAGRRAEVEPCANPADMPHADDRRLNVDSLKVGIEPDWHVTMDEIVDRLQLRQLVAAEAMHAARMAKFLAAQSIDLAAVQAAARTRAAALTELKAKLGALRAAFDAARVLARAPTPAPLSLMLRHFVLCRGAHVASDVLHFVQGHMVYREFTPEPTYPPMLLSIKDLLQATERIKEASLFGVLRSVGYTPPDSSFAPDAMCSDASLKGGVPDEARPLGDRFVDSLWALYNSNVDRVLAEAECALQRARAVRESLIHLAEVATSSTAAPLGGGTGKDKENNRRATLAFGIALANEAIFSAQVHFDRCSARLEPTLEGSKLQPFSKHIGAHGCVLQASHRAFKQLIALLSALADDDDGQPTGAGVSRARKRRLYEKEVGEEEAGEDPVPAGEAATAPNAAALAPSQEHKVVAEKGSPAAPAQPSAFTRVLGGAAAMFIRRPAPAATSALPAAAVVESKISYSVESDVDDAAAAGIECSLAPTSANGQLQLQIKNAADGVALSPLFLKIEHIVRADAVGDDLKRRWDSDAFTELRTHEYELLDMEAISAGETRCIQVQWPACRSRHLSIVFTRAATPAV